MHSVRVPCPTPETTYHWNQERFMSYGMEYGYPTVAARAEPSARAMFIRRTYGHLAGAILAFVALEAVLIKAGFDQVALGMLQGQGQLAWLVVLGAFMFASWLANRWAHSDVSAGLQYMGLGLYVVAEAAIFLPLLGYARQTDPGAIPTAGILTLAVFAGLTAAVFVTRR